MIRQKFIVFSLIALAYGAAYADDTKLKAPAFTRKDVLIEVENMDMSKVFRKSKDAQINELYWIQEELEMLRNPTTTARLASSVEEDMAAQTKDLARKNNMSVTTFEKAARATPGSEVAKAVSAADRKAYFMLRENGKRLKKMADQMRDYAYVGPGSVRAQISPEGALARQIELKELQIAQLERNIVKISSKSKSVPVVLRLTQAEQIAFQKNPRAFWPSYLAKLDKELAVKVAKASAIIAVGAAGYFAFEAGKEAYAQWYDTSGEIEIATVSDYKEAAAKQMEESNFPAPPNSNH